MVIGMEEYYFNDDYLKTYVQFHFGVIFMNNETTEY